MQAAQEALLKAQPGALSWPLVADPMPLRSVVVRTVGAVISSTTRAPRRLHRRHSSGAAKSPQLAFELRPLRISDDGEVLKPDGMLSEDEDAALRRTIAALVLNLRGIDPDLRESGLDVLSSLATRRCPSACLYSLCLIHPWPVNHLLLVMLHVQPGNQEACTRLFLSLLCISPCPVNDCLLDMLSILAIRGLHLLVSEPLLCQPLACQRWPAGQ